MSVNNLLLDSDWTTAKPFGPQRNCIPFDGDNTVYYFEEDYTISLASFAVILLNTPHPVRGTFILVKETEPQPVGVYDVVKWTRTYAITPNTRSEFSSMVYPFIGYTGYIAATGGTLTSNVPGRKPFSRTVNCRIQYDYFFAGTGGAYLTPSAIPVNQQQLYYFRIGSITNPGGVLTWTATYTLGSANDISQGSPTQYLVDTTGTYAPPNSIVPCVPTRTAYMALVSAGSEIIAEPSSLSRWMGNIWVRTTKYVIAQ